MKSLQFALFLGLTISSSAIMLSTYTDCGDQKTIHSVQLEPCDAEPCHIDWEQNYTAHINFTANEASTSLTNVCHGIFFGMEEEYKVTPSNPCGHGVICPLTKGLAQMYTATVHVPPSQHQAPLRFAGKWEVKDERNRDLICLVFPLRIN